ncbi:helix-hairpin-helix domain-containing protein [Rurimicrobium arvi]|uniref:Helix-hairpin-helix domain-containing protein n=1 Tax=Rurimicrobium arvi TaxID=2049916 RepID=A0ABP8MRA7_9BACT
MSQDLKSLFQFTRREKRGLITLLSIVTILLLSGRWYNALHEAGDPFLLSGDLAKKWKAYNQDNQQSIVHQSWHPDDAAHPFPFDPNTLDSPGFIKLGLDAGTTGRLMNWRRKGKVFYNAEEFGQLYGLSPDLWTQLRPFVRVAAKRNNDHFRSYEQTPLPAELDLNTVDSATLVRIDGIGPFLAHKIIAQRTALGSYLSNLQLSEVHRFPDSVLRQLRRQLVVRSNTVKKIRLNDAGEAELARHPYIGAQMAKNIILLRGGLTKYEKIEQLRQVPLMNEEKYRKIAPYCIIE